MELYMIFYRYVYVSNEHSILVVSQSQQLK